MANTVLLLVLTRRGILGSISNPPFTFRLNKGTQLLRATRPHDRIIAHGIWQSIF